MFDQRENGQHQGRNDASHQTLQEVAQTFKLLSDVTRLRILFALERRQAMHVTAICELVGQSQPAVSHHLSLLHDAGILSRRRDGKHNYYALKLTRFGELLDRWCAHLATDQRQLQFEPYVISYQRHSNGSPCTDHCGNRDA